MIAAIIAGQNDDAVMALLRVFKRNITNCTCPELQQVAENVLQALNSWLWWPRDQREKYQTVPRWSLSSTFHCYLHTSFLSVRPVVLCSLAECTMTCNVGSLIWGTCAITYFKDCCKHWTLKTTVSRRVSLLSKLRCTVDIDTRTLFFSAHIKPHVDYRTDVAMSSKRY